MVVNENDKIEIFHLGYLHSYTLYDVYCIKDLYNQDLYCLRVRFPLTLLFSVTGVRIQIKLVL